MGYCSSICFSMNKVAVKMFMEEIQNNPPSVINDIIEFIDYSDACYTNDDGGILIEWTDIKWGNLPTTHFIENFVASIAGTNHNDYLSEDVTPDVTFIRSGEELGDVEETSGPLYVNEFEIYIPTGINHSGTTTFDVADLIKKTINFKGEKK